MQLSNRSLRRLTEALSVFGHYTIQPQYNDLYILLLKGSVSLLGVGLLHKVIKIDGILRSVAGLSADTTADTIIDNAVAAADQQPPAPKTNGGFITMKSLIGLLTVAAIMCIWLGVARADDPAAYFKAGQFEFTYPLAHTNAVALYDLWRGEGLVGAETRLASYPREPQTIKIFTDITVPANSLNLNFGAATSGNADGMPFLSLDDTFAHVGNYANLGIAAGHDFKRSENRIMIKYNVPID